MKIYYDENALEILTEEEAKERIEKNIIFYERHLDILREMDLSDIWEIITPIAKEQIIEEAKEEELKRHFISREIYL